MEGGTPFRLIYLRAAKECTNRALQTARLGKLGQCGEGFRIDKAFGIVEVELAYAQTKPVAALGVAGE